MLITPEYLALQKQLHGSHDYGRGVDAQECADIVREFDGVASVLDYGCGQGHLGRLLKGYEIEEYDPCIDGKDELPARCDAVVCADVLEHIEPECLHDVLVHIRSLTKKFAVFVIATGPSRKVLADGRSAHLIVEGAGYWFQKLTGLFDFVRFEDRTETNRGLLIVCTPRPVHHKLPIGRIRVTSVVPDEDRNAQVEANCRRVAKRLDLCIPAHDRTAVLVCYGPSLRQTWPQIAIDRHSGKDVFSVSGAHAFLVERGITPTAHMDCDPREHKARMIGAAQKGVAYWLASCVHPSYLDKLDGFDVTLWHSYNGEQSLKAKDIYPNQMMVTGGGSIGLRAVSLLYARGYRTFEVHGMDCCNAADGEDHAGEHFGKKSDAAPVECNGRWFNATAIQIAYLRYFAKSHLMFPDAVFKFHGDGLLQHSLKG